MKIIIIVLFFTVNSKTFANESDMRINDEGIDDVRDGAEWRFRTRVANPN